MQSPPAIVLLATGPGRRSGAVAHPIDALPDGRGGLPATLQQALRTGWPVCVVLTPALLPLAAPWVATRDLVVLDDGEAVRGLGHAIAAGVAARADAAGWVVLPADMPRVKPESILAVGRALAEQPVAYAQYRGRAGHPRAFAAELFSELIDLQGDEGARRLLARYPAAAVEVDDPGVLDTDSETGLDAARLPADLQTHPGSAG